MTGRNAHWVGSLAHKYIKRRCGHSIVVNALTPSAHAWKRLSKAAALGRIRVILAPWFRRGEHPRRRVITAWRFPDGSFIVHVTRSSYPASLEVMSAAGIAACMIRDSRSSIAAALHASLPVYEDLVLAYIEHHRELPRLDADAVLAALQTDNQEIRLAAMSSLSRMLLPTSK